MTTPELLECYLKSTGQLKEGYTVLSGFICNDKLRVVLKTDKGYNITVSLSLLDYITFVFNSFSV